MMSFSLKKTLKSISRKTNSYFLKNDAKMLYHIRENYFKLYKTFRKRQILMLCLYSIDNFT